ncbi:MAG: hypothetical protein FJX59_14560, partial [Alphaproteobacteria bacterium]|nr:hypothetical protein [Alphaproteobacteria bacterium]
MRRKIITACLAIATGWSTAAHAADDEQDPTRRRPGPAEPQRPLPPIDPTAVPPPSRNLPREVIPIPDRWRLVEAVGVKENWWDPYNQNTLKADRPLFDDWFINIGAISDTVYEPRGLPTPVAPQSTENPNSVDLFGREDQRVFSQNVIGSLSFIKGDTAYKPPDYEFRFTPVFNYNHVTVKEDRVLRIDPRAGTKRGDSHVGVQELFFDYHIRNVSTRYDFDSIRVGIQPMTLDFRGFLFQDNQLGIRLFGNRDENKF